MLRRLRPGIRLVALILPRVHIVRPSSVSPTPLLLTVSDTARRLRRHEQTVRAMIRRGDLAAIRLGRLVRVLAAAVDRAGTAVREAPVRPRAPRRTLRRVGT